MIVYVDTSVVLARLFAEDRSPPDAFWKQRLVASRLLEYEVFNRVHARGGLKGVDSFTNCRPARVPKVGQRLEQVLKIDGLRWEASRAHEHGIRHCLVFGREVLAKEA